MTNENYKAVKKKYIELITKRELYTQLESRLRKLQENKSMLELDLNVQKYISTLTQIDEIIEMLPSERERDALTDERILTLAANQVMLEQNTNNIYVYMGTYDYSGESDIIHGSSVVLLPDDAKDFGWKMYKNIELGYYESEITVPKTELNNFLEESTILYAPTEMTPNEFYNKVRNAFFETLIELGQEAAVKKVKSEFDTVKIASSSEEGPKLVKKCNN